jgi:tetratricopeptide (TPR) repeat protein
LNLYVKMKNKIDYNKNIDLHITDLKHVIGNDNAKEDLRRFAHHIRNFEYSGEYHNDKSKLLIKAEIIKAIYKLCENSEENLDNIKKILHRIFQLNLKIYENKAAHDLVANMLAEQISNLDSENKFSVLIIKAQENHFSVIIEKLFDKLEHKDINLISSLLINLCYGNFTKNEIFKQLNKAVKQYPNFPIRIHLIDKNINGKNIINLYDREKHANIRIYNFFSQRITTGYCKLYYNSNKIPNLLSLNIVHSISYILAKLNLKVNLTGKKIESTLKSNNNNLIFQDNVNNIIEYTLDRLASEDKFVIGSLDRKFNLNKRVKNKPAEVKQININELDHEGLLNLKQTVDQRIKIVNKVNQMIDNLESDKFELFLEENQKLIPQLIIDQAKLKRAKAFYKKGLQYDQNHQPNSAVEMYGAAINLDNKFKEAFISRALNYYKREDFDNAIKDFSKITTLDNSNINAYHLRGISYAKTNLLALAIKDFNTILNIEKKTK